MKSIKVYVEFACGHNLIRLFKWAILNFFVFFYNLHFIIISVICVCYLSELLLNKFLKTVIRDMAKESNIKINKLKGYGFGFWRIQIEYHLYQKKVTPTLELKKLRSHEVGELGCNVSIFKPKLSLNKKK